MLFKNLSFLLILMRRNKLFHLKNLLVNRSFVRYGFVGSIYTLATPLIFIFLSQYVSRTNAIIIIYPTGYFLKYFLYKKWVFNNDSVNFKKFLLHVIPIFLVALILTRLTNFIYEVRVVAILLVIVSGLIGYIWGKLVYRKK